jgi:hypothetical protein
VRRRMTWVASLAPRSGVHADGLGSTAPFPIRRADEQKPPKEAPGGQNNSIGWASAFDRVTALPVCGLGGRNGDAHLLAQDTGKEPSDRVGLPSGGFHEFFPADAPRPSQQVENPRGFAALPGSNRLFGQLRRLSARVGFLRRGGLLPRPGLRRRNVAPVCPKLRPFGSRGPVGRAHSLDICCFFWNPVHVAFSFGGDYRDHTDHSVWQRLQADFGGNSQGRKIAVQVGGRC